MGAEEHQASRTLPVPGFLKFYMRFRLCPPPPPHTHIGGACFTLRLPSLQGMKDGKGEGGQGKKEREEGKERGGKGWVAPNSLHPPRPGNPQQLPLSPLSGPEPALGGKRGVRWGGKGAGLATRLGEPGKSSPWERFQAGSPLGKLPCQNPHIPSAHTPGRLLHYKRILCFTRGLSTWET